MTTTVAGDKPSPVRVAEKPTLVALWRTAIGQLAGTR
ncbi:hypothetical protein EV644_12644 [Kribbella orskensis]|uniref:Uncharacterized protein n=1 Tax=Kribbella orskensis TaxID=2512216 RepID=A0ABY2B9K5_9ACTN|nr:hypothetical protein EV642_12956 [Kribbella sp. VKM Ac-2500]TCO12301.1 hypothetical protein EV644_12644 [Kribbella orskensis]